ncbi:hypothetical protein [Serratia fonticola]|uniref:hypothetical protein n=1 Tax=Serratia fonticola TaxID=47917 RepID=UPI000465E319|nr:hypothetical protein [Serratia fonticola]
MSTRKKITAALRAKGLEATMEYDRQGPMDWSYWYVYLTEESMRKLKAAGEDPAFTGVIEFCEFDEGMEKVAELLDCSGIQEQKA